MSLKLPSEIMMNEERKLQEQVEYLITTGVEIPTELRKRAKLYKTRRPAEPNFTYDAH